MRIYLSGPITGVGNYREQFQAAAEKLREEGFSDIVNPAELCEVLPATASWDDYMRIDLELLEMCEVIVLLPGWQASLGSQREYGYAMAKDMLIWEMKA